MNIVERLTRELSYNAWANRTALKSLQAAQTVPERVAEVFAHIIAAEWLWLGRLGQTSSTLAVWPQLALHECDQQLRALSATWKSYLDSATEELLNRDVTYTNSKGERWTNAVADVVTHVVLHSSYHRGQVASLLGRAGAVAAYTDYIECVRRGYLEGGWPETA